MDEKTNQNLPKFLNNSQISLLTQKTPQQFIKTRPGPAGITLKYVEVGYVINLLNQIFGWNWDYRVIDQQIGSHQVWVRGELTVRTENQTIAKGQYGGAEIKFNRNTGEAISIADDLKTAASDSLKKCASMIGVAADIYWQDLESWGI